jgi:hypothetical protein
MRPLTVGPLGRRLKREGWVATWIETIAVDGGRRRMDFGVDGTVGEGGGAGSAERVS